MHEALKREFQHALRDTFEIIREIGRGAYGTVFLAGDNSGRNVALKVLDPELFRDGGEERFLRECRAVGRLVHPRILPILQAGQAAGLLYYTTPYFAGGSLRDRLNGAPLLPHDAFRVASQVADALTYAHSHQVLHRDIKPGNVLLDDPNALVKDFWIARALSRAVHERMTGAGLVIGTPEYMSPEQMAGTHQLDARSDVYALAVLLCEMLTGQLPFAAGPAQIVVEKLSREPRLTDLPATIPRPLAEVLIRALTKRPEDRVANPQALINDIRSALPGALVDHVRPLSTLELGRGVLFGKTKEPVRVAGTASSPVRLRLRGPTRRQVFGLGTLVAAAALLAASLLGGLEPKIAFTFGALGLSVTGLALTLSRRSSTKPPLLESLRAPTDLQQRLRDAIKYQYEITREIGHGGMAFVYLARDLRYRRRSVAIKVMRPEIAIGMGYEKFMDEIEIMAQLSHPGILTVLDYGDADGLPFFVMPFVDGESVKSRLDTEGPLSLDLALSVVRDVGRALDYAHRKKIIHRDIKPENILWYEGQAVLADFGIARVVDRARQSSFSQHVRLGTPEFMSPEQFWDTKRIDHRSDIYSLGCVLFEMLAGKTPYEGTPEELAVKHLNDPVPHVRSLRTDVPADIDSAICKALSKQQADRFDSAVAFVAALEHPDHHPV